MKIAQLMVTAAILISTHAAALTTREVDFECPIDGEAFKQVMADTTVRAPE